jgi:hypothetical protein
MRERQAPQEREMLRRHVRRHDLRGEVGSTP